MVAIFYSMPVVIIVVIIVVRAVGIISTCLPFIIVMTVVVAVLFNSMLLNSMFFNPLLPVDFVQLAVNFLLMLAALSFISSSLMDRLIVLMIAKFFVAFIAVRSVRICQYFNREGQ